MQKTKLLLTALALAILSATAHGQTTVFQPSIGDWNDAANWNAGIPGDGNTLAVVNNGREAIVSNDVVFEVATIRIANNSAQGNLTVTAGSLKAESLQVATAAGSTGIIAISGGSLGFDGSVRFASQNAGPTLGSLVISGGSFAWGLDAAGAVLDLGSQGPGTLEITGDTASVSGRNANLFSNATVSFTLGENGVTPVTGTAALTISEGASLLVDGSAFTGSLGSITLFEFNSIDGSFGENVTFQNFGSLSPQLSQEGGMLMLIPEPRVYGLALGLLALAGIGLRRLRARA